MHRIGLVFLLIFGSATAQDNWNITNIRDLATDWFKNVKVAGDYAYCATRYGISVMDVSDRENPEVINRIPRNGTPSSLEISDTLLYLCGGSAGFSIFSISDPEQPVEIGFCDEVRNPSRFELRDTLAFIACYRTGLSIVSVADPYNPRIIGEIRTDFGNCDDVALMGDYAYLSAGTHIISIEDPTHPELITSVNEMSGGEIDIVDDIFYTATKTYSLENPLEPRFIGYFYEGDHSNQYTFDLDNNNIFLGISRTVDHHFFKVITCVDISDPENLREIGYAEMYSIDPVKSRIIEYEEDYVYIISGEYGTIGQYGMSICDFRNPEHPEEVSAYYNATYNNYVVMNGDYLYVSDKHRHLSTYSIGDPYNPVLIDSLSWNFISVYDGILRMVGNEEFICLNIGHDREDRFQNDISIISLAEPDSPEEIGWLKLNFSTTAATMVLNDNYLFFTHRYVRFHPGTVSIISLTDPENPEIIGHFGEYSHGYGLDIEGDLMAVGFYHDHERGLVLADISDLENIVELGRCELNYQPNDVTIIGDYVYVDEGNTLFIISISDPENPQIVTEFHGLHGPPVNYAYEDGYLLILEGSSGFEILSLEEPEEPIVTGRYHTPESAQNLVSKDGLAYSAECSNLGIYDVSRALGAWYLDLSAETNDFGEVPINSVAEWELTIHNLSSRSREITDIILDDDVFECSFEEVFELSAESDTTFTITFTPASDTSYTSVLEVVSNDHSIDVQLFGRGIILDAAAEEPEVGYNFALYDAYPNPFNSSTHIRYTLDQDGFVTLKLYDLAGREVASLANEKQSAGNYQTVWDTEGRPSGMYLLRLHVDGRERVTKLILIR